MNRLFASLNSRQLLILLGLIGQSLSWEGPALLWFNVFLWVFCVFVLQHKVRLPAYLDPLVLMLGCVAGYYVCRAAGQSTHFFLGHGMTALQAIRLLRPLNRREKIYSILMAVFHVGVACTILFDYRFIGILVAAIVLIPRALRELEWENQPAGTTAGVSMQGAAAISPGGMRWSAYLVISALTLLFFLLFPRGLLPGLQARPAGIRGQGNLLDSILDPASGGGPLSGRILLQIEGEKIGYLRAHVLTQFDGQQWKAVTHPLIGEVPALPRARSTSLLRRVRVKQLRHLGNALPADGHVQAINGKFFRRASRNNQDLVRSAYLFNTADTFYQYWTFPESVGTNILRSRNSPLLEAPPPSERIRAWVLEVTAGATNALHGARLLERHFQSQFTYRIGAPDLNRLNTLEDFLFVRREGHCERFASALALLLRQQKIPTRVGLGYVPGGPNRLSGWQTVRFRDAHAWTEAWFPETGWVILDATPRGSLPMDTWQMNDFLDAVDLAWSGFVLNFDQSTQNYLLGSAVKSVGQLFLWAHQQSGILMGILAVGVLIFLLRKIKRAGRTCRRAVVTPQRLVENFYGDMLQILSRAGHHRQPHQTPFEFLQELDRAAVPCLDDIGDITRHFCAVHYGIPGPLPEGFEHQIRNTISRIRQQYVKH